MVNLPAAWVQKFLFVWFAAQKSPFLIEISTIFNPKCFLSNLRSMIQFINYLILLWEFSIWLTNSISLISQAPYVVSIIKFNVLPVYKEYLPVYDGCCMTHHYHHIKDKNNYYLTACLDTDGHVTEASGNHEKARSHQQIPLGYDLYIDPTRSPGDLLVG